MRFSILVLESPYQRQAADSAYRFARAVLEKGHQIRGIFFYMNGVHNANKYQKPPGERNLGTLWTQLQQEHNLDFVACIAASTWRGMNEDLALPGFRIAGLGQLALMIQESDRLVTFGG
ncbi:MAG: sulfurtransferase complex subunit TusD [Anaerolineae bacterium]|nr:MAG: sulfurtransferase complex subunit TusD [Anaerolineae bacterium]